MCRTGMPVLKEYSTFNHAKFYEIILLSCAAWRKSGTNKCNISVFPLTNVNVRGIFNQVLIIVAGN